MSVFYYFRAVLCSIAKSQRQQRRNSGMKVPLTASRRTKLAEVKTISQNDISVSAAEGERDRERGRERHRERGIERQRERDREREG